MTRIRYLCLLLQIISPSLHAQDSDTALIARIIPDSIVLAPLIYLASDDLKGRHIGGAGINIAANYIVTQLRKAGARPVPRATSYFQVFTKILSRHDLSRVGQDLRYKMPGFEAAKNSLITIISGSPIIQPKWMENWTASSMAPGTTPRALPQ
jgi:hypothetical protein